VTVEKSGSRLGVGNDRTGAQLPPHDLQYDAWLRHNGGRSASKRRQMWRISSKLILNCTRTMWKNERQAGEITGN
jgi:hypothetical protein